MAVAWDQTFRAAFCTVRCALPHSSSAPSQPVSRSSLIRTGFCSAPPKQLGLLGVASVATATGAALGARAASRRRCQGSRVDSHLHLWTPDTARYPYDSPPPAQLVDDARATHERFVDLMDEAGVAHAVAVQPINYWQDCSYLMDAMDAHPSRLKGVFIADPSSEDGAAAAADRLEQRAKSHPGWVGVRFNPYKWPASASMADAVGKAMFRRAGDCGLVVGFMPFKGLSKHVADIEALISDSPETQVIIDHWGFFLQPATGVGGDRAVDEQSWSSLLQLSRYPKVSVKISALFRVASDSLPYASLSDKLAELLEKFGPSRLLWGSDFPYVTEHGNYVSNMNAIESWPVWGEMSDSERADVMGGTAIRLFGSFPESDDTNRSCAA